ncbi:TPA: hypothetical protein ACN334_002744 [Vibrio parahaemolyticus]
MTFRYTFGLFFGQLPFFFFLGLFILAGYDFVTEETRSLLFDVFNEHMAPKSIVVIFGFSLLISSLFLIFWGKVGSGYGSEWVYKYFIVQPIKFAIGLCSAAFSMSLSLCLITFFEYREESEKLFFASLYVPLVALLFWIITKALEENSFMNSKLERRVLGFLFLLGAWMVKALIVPSLI